ncbi:MAG: acylglycerol kinase family protein, partial [Clostridiales Family XIII bacterium]|nr:acylglycerol kinase family protein [Clostridiales Family XIII bacterium]
MAEKVLLFYNPKAGNGVFSSSLDRVIEVFQSRGQIVVPLRASGEGLLDKAFADPAFRGYSK